MYLKERNIERYSVNGDVHVLANEVLEEIKQFLLAENSDLSLITNIQRFTYSNRRYNVATLQYKNRLPYIQICARSYNSNNMLTIELAVNFTYTLTPSTSTITFTYDVQVFDANQNKAICNVDLYFSDDSLIINLNRSVSLSTQSTKCLYIGAGVNHLDNTDKELIHMGTLDDTVYSVLTCYNYGSWGYIFKEVSGANEVFGYQSFGVPYKNSLPDGVCALFKQYVTLSNMANSACTPYVIQDVSIGSGTPTALTVGSDYLIGSQRYRCIHVISAGGANNAVLIRIDRSDG